jgi:G3E family GTPase
MPPTPPLPVTVLTGFLGSGKTTLLNRLLGGPHGLRLAVIVNDFGAINIDAALVDVTNDDTLELSNGCVCCSMRGGLVATVRRILSREVPPQHLIVEASGIADPAAIAQIFRLPSLQNTTRLDGIIALADAEHIDSPRLDRVLVETQLRTADVVILNKIDLVTSDALDRLEAWIGDLAPGVHIVRAVQAAVPLPLVMDVDTARVPALANNVEGDDAFRHPGFETWSYWTDRPLAYRKVRAALERLPEGIFRVKGILALADAPNLTFVAHRVGRRVTIDVLGPGNGEPPETRLVCIGEPGSLTPEDLTARLDACATDAIPLQPRQSFTGRAQSRV